MRADFSILIKMESFQNGSGDLMDGTREHGLD
jgi:hypothetical protein